MSKVVSREYSLFGTFYPLWPFEGEPKPSL